MKHSRPPMPVPRSFTPARGTPVLVGAPYTYRSAGVEVSDIVGRGVRSCVYCPNLLWSDVEDSAHHCPGRLAVILGVHHG